MKAILVIDMPEACADGCPVMCRARGINHRPSWCPLKPMPDIKTEEAIKLSNMINPKSTFQEFADGWNACIKEIEK